VLRVFVLSLILLPINIVADAFLSSPKLSLNSQGERVIEFKIQSARISDEDIILKEYKSNELLNLENISYTLLEDFSSYKTYSIVLNNSYDGNYFNFKLVIEDQISKDIFIFLPSKLNSSSKKPKPTQVYKPAIIEKSNDVPIEILPAAKEIKKELRVIKASEISTMWSLATNIKADMSDASIYQIMWSIYLGNKDAFIDGNINLVRNDKDLIVPSYSSISETSHTEAKASILAMNESYSLSIAPAVKSLLVLTAPKIIEAPEQKVKEIVDEDESKQLDINNEELNNPADIIKNNTKTLEMAFESKVAEELIKETEDIKPADVQEFGLMDLLFVALVSILSGILIALIYIQLKSRQTKKIDYDFDEAPDTSSSVAGLPKGLSITNNEEEQQLDLAVTYFEMGDLENSKSILDELMKSTQSDKIKNDAKTLLDKFSEK
jgi:FimV-like protein